MVVSVKRSAAEAIALLSSPWVAPRWAKTPWARSATGCYADHPDDPDRLVPNPAKARAHESTNARTTMTTTELGREARAGQPMGREDLRVASAGLVLVLLAVSAFAVWSSQVTGIATGRAVAASHPPANR